MIRQLPPEAYNGVKSAWKMLVQLLGGVQATAACTRASISLASEYGAPHTDRFVPADIILDAETIAGQPYVTAALARAQGYALMPVELRGAGDLSRLLAALGRDFGALFAEAAEALADGHIDAGERDRLARHLDQVARAAMEARMHLRSEGEQT